MRVSGVAHGSRRPAPQRRAGIYGIIFFRREKNQNAARQSQICHASYRGLAQRKNNWDLSTDYYRAPQPRFVAIDRKRPGEGHRHVLKKSDIYRFLQLLPDWDELAIGLNAIVLAPGDYGADGYHILGVVHVCAWDANLWQYLTPNHYMAHKDIYARFGVIGELTDQDDYLCKFDEDTVRGYQLLHILLHELGHHHDRMTSKLKKRSGRGEWYAEDYARQYEKKIWNEYTKAFRL